MKVLVVSVIFLIFIVFVSSALGDEEENTIENHLRFKRSCLPPGCVSLGCCSGDCPKWCRMCKINFNC
uniref:Uncharacterized protein n=1 Tax=Acrobeloides nanus TaxID=290746 RepID=A0A914C708_9BILA